MVATAHVPTLAAGDDHQTPRRALLLAGGGIRVAYQAGVLLAFEEAGLRFTHADGTSGGTFNLAMLLSGVTPAQACERWRTLDVRAFASFWPIRRLLRGPPYPALAPADSIRDRVLPRLGVDVERVRAAQGIAGTFNVCDFEAKECVAVPHDEADLELLVAGVSLPIVSPAVKRNGRQLVDAVWIKDANVAEALRRDPNELWLVWCIGNHGIYRDGAFQQYVHMIEIAANGALQRELAAMRELNALRDAPVQLHVIRPRVPLPLDPDFFLGRVNADTLVAMGYRDAACYLDDPPPGGVTPDGTATRMADPVPGVAFRERLTGTVGGSLELRVGWEVDDLAGFLADPDHRGSLAADVTHAALGTRRPARDGRFWIAADGTVRAQLIFTGGARLELHRRRRKWNVVKAGLHDAQGLELGTGRLELVGAAPWRTLHARGVGSAREGARTVARFWRWALSPGGF
jgi:predicted acylesterase/phospholipase RssA